jgi:hypothetical protein
MSTTRSRGSPVSLSTRTIVTQSISLSCRGNERCTMNWRNWRFFGKVFVTVSCIFLGLLVELGWKEISFGYKRNYQSNVTFDHHEQQQAVSSFHSRVQWKQNDSWIFEEIEREFRSLVSCESDWILSWNSSEAIVDSKPLSGAAISMSVTEVPLVRIRINSSSQNPQHLLNKLFTPQGLSLLHLVSSLPPLPPRLL